MDENREIRTEIAEMLETELRDPDFLEEADLDEERIERLLSSDALRQIAGELAEQEERSQEAYCGTPEQVAKCKKSYTGQYLKKKLCD